MYPCSCRHIAFSHISFSSAFMIRTSRDLFFFFEYATFAFTISLLLQGKHVPVWDAEFAQCTDARIWVHELDLSDIRALAAAGPSGRSSSEALLRPPDPLHPSPFKPLIEATAAEAEAARQKEEEEGAKEVKPAGPVKKGHKSPVLAALAARGTLARPSADLVESVAWGEGHEGENGEDDDEDIESDDEGGDDDEDEMTEGSDPMVASSRAPLVWHSMNLTGSNGDDDDDDRPKNHALSHWLPNGGLNGPMAACAPLVDFGDALATAAANGDSSIRSHVALSDSSSTSSSSRSHHHRRVVRARRAARRAAREAGPWPSVSLLVWAEDLGDELRADPGQVEALWRSLQSSDAFVALSAPGDHEPAWQGSAPEAQKKLRQKKLHQQKKKAKKRKMAAAGGKSSHISSLHPTFSGLSSQDDEGSEEDSSISSSGKDDGANKALTAGDVIVGVDDPGMGASNDSDTSDDDDENSGSRAKNRGGWQALVRGVGHGPAFPFRGWRPIPCELVVVTTGGLLEGQKHKETLEDRLARHSTGRIALRVLRSDLQDHNHPQQRFGFAEVTHWAALASGGDLLVFLKPNVIPLKGWLTDMLHVYLTNGKNKPKATKQSKTRSACSDDGSSSGRSSNDVSSNCRDGHDVDGDREYSSMDEGELDTEETAGIVGAVVLYPSGRVFSAGLEYHDTPVASPSEAKALAAAAAESAKNSNEHHHDSDERGSSDHQSDHHGSSSSNPGVVLPAHRLRGYGARDARLEAGSAWPAAGVTRHCLLVSRELFFSLGGFQADLSGSLADADLALKLFEANGKEVNRREANQQRKDQQQEHMAHDEEQEEDENDEERAGDDSRAGNLGRGAAAWVAAAAAERDVESLVDVGGHGSHTHNNASRAHLFAKLPRVLVATGARVVSSNPESYPELENSYAAQAFDFQFGAERARSVEARRHFVSKWGATLARSLAHLRMTSAQLSWIVHCGGSQGYEAASIIGALEPLAKSRLIVRRYRDCEHTDTLSGTPGSFRDAFDRAALRRFAGAYQPPTTTATPLLQSKLSTNRRRRSRASSRGSNGTVAVEVDAAPSDGNTGNQLSAADGQSAAMLASSTAENADVAASAAARVAARAAAHSKRLFHEAAIEARSSSSSDGDSGGSSGGNGKAAHAAALAAARAAGVLSFGGQARLPSAPSSTSESSPDPSSSGSGGVLNATAAATAGAWVSYEASANHQGAGAIAVYARDWREAGRWLPRDAAFVVGRYMFEAASLPEAWVHHCNSLDEIWVPSKWQVDAFAQSGVQRHLLAVMPEALDVWHYDPRDAATSPLPLAGTLLDGRPLNDPLRPFVFLSVFKMEDRKGWRELVKAYMTEFEGTQDPNTGRDTVVLLLRTYVHVEGSGFVHSKAKVMDKITRYLSKTIGYHPDSSRPWPRVEVVQEHLPAASMPSLYKAADCFVLPTHGEGWGLPTMEAMAMGLPVITTNWGGSTEFVTPGTGYLLNIEGVVSTQQTLDSPYKGNRWAQPSSRHLRALMREVRTSLTDPHTGQVLRGRQGRGPTSATKRVSESAGEAAAAAAALAGAHAAVRGRPSSSSSSASSSSAAARGIMARAHIVESYRPSMVAAIYAQRLDHIHRTKLLPAAQAKAAAAAAATKAANSAAVAAAARAAEASSTTTPPSLSSSSVASILAPPPEGDFYRGDEVVASLDSGWQLSESYATCSVRSRPFSLRDLPLNSPARAPRGVGTARVGTRGDGGVGGGNLCHIAILSTYVPRECGIAIYSERLVQGLTSVCGDGARIEVIPVKHANMALSEYDPATVKVAIREWELDDYLDAAAYVNREGFGVVLLQYEFGIWPVAHVLCFAKAVKTRLITTIHTVARTYASEEYHAYVAQLSVVSHKLTVMTERMRHELDAFHAIPPHRIAVIPHGTPRRPLRRVQNTPRQVYFPGRKVIMSNGLMHGYKGIEYMLEAMPAVLARHPNALYLVDGKPHPGGWGVQGYYAGLKRRATELGLMGTAVVFHNTFTPYDELLAKLEASWVYVNPYTDASQSVSGTVAMALSVGTAVVSTPYPYAAETLTNGVGVFVPFRDSNALAVAISDLLDSPLKVAQLNIAAHAYAQNMTWEKVARSHLDLARSLGDD